MLTSKIKITCSYIQTHSKLLPQINCFLDQLECLSNFALKQTKEIFQDINILDLRKLLRKLVN